MDYRGQDDGYATADGYGGYAPGDSYAAYDDYAQDGGYGYPAGDGYGAGYDQGTGYADGDGYGRGYPNGQGYGDGYPDGDGYGGPDGYGQQPAYGDNGYGSTYRAGGFGSGPYEQPQAGRRLDDTYIDNGFGSGPYPQPQPGRRLDDTYIDNGFGSGPYERPQPGGGGYGGGSGRPGGYGRSGGYPALGAGPAGRDDFTGRRGDAGNDWYAGQPAAASGSGFADTGVYTLSARAIEQYGTGPRRLERSGQQERYDDSEYEAYPDYGGQRDFADSRGYSAPGGYQASPGYDEYQEPAAFGTRGYGAEPDYDDYDDAGDPYQERYREDGTGRPGRPGGRGNQNARGGKRGRRTLLISALTVVVAVVIGAAAYAFVLKPKQSAGTSLPSAGPLPTAGSTAATAACVKEFGEYCHIELRTDDPVPLTLAELFPPAFTNETDHTSFTRIAMKLDTTCSNAVIGQDLINALQSDGCTQVLRASYVSGNNTVMGTIGVVNLATTNEAHYAGKVVGANDFVAPLATSTGVGAKLGSGTGVVEAEFKGHYLILTWAEFVNGNAPSTKAQDQQLEQFETDMVAGTANISLSQRMVNGAPASAGG